MTRHSIGEHLELDLQRRELCDRRSAKKTQLSQAVCHCLLALAQARGDTVSPEALLEAGWRQFNFEVTANSVRAAIAQLRNALLSLQVAEEIQILNVPRQGYQLILPTPGPGHEAAEPDVDNVSVYLHTEATNAVAEPEMAAPHSAPTPFIWWKAAICLLAGSVLAAGAVALFGAQPIKVSYAPAQVTLPPGIDGVYLQQSPAVSQTSVNEVLRRWPQDHPTSPFRLLYINATLNPHHSSFFACKKPPGEPASDCESFYIIALQPGESALPGSVSAPDNSDSLVLPP